MRYGQGITMYHVLVIVFLCMTFCSFAMYQLDLNNVSLVQEHQRTSLAILAFCLKDGMRETEIGTLFNNKLASNCDVKDRAYALVESIKEEKQFFGQDKIMCAMLDKLQHLAQIHANITTYEFCIPKLLPLNYTLFKANNHYTYSRYQYFLGKFQGVTDEEQYKQDIIQTVEVMESDKIGKVIKRYMGMYTFIRNDCRKNQEIMECMFKHVYKKYVMLSNIPNLILEYSIAYGFIHGFEQELACPVYGFLSAQYREKIMLKKNRLTQYYQNMTIDEKNRITRFMQFAINETERELKLRLEELE